MKTKRQSVSLRRCSLIALLLSAALFPSSGWAAIITEGFDAPEGGLPEDWTPVYRSSTNTQAEIVQIQEINETLGNALRFHRPASGGAGSFSSAALYYTGTDNQIKDFSAEVTLRLGATLSSSSVGIMLRTQSLGYAFNATPFGGYYVALTSTGLGIYENPTAHNALGAELAVDPFESAANTDYLFRVSAAGETISASLWNTDGTIELATVTYSSAQNEDGYFGFRSGFANSDMTGYFRDLTIDVIPEPAAVSLLSLSLLALGFRRQRNKTKFLS